MDEKKTYGVSIPITIKKKKEELGVNWEFLIRQGIRRIEEEKTIEHLSESMFAENNRMRRALEENKGTLKEIRETIQKQQIEIWELQKKCKS